MRIIHVLIANSNYAFYCLGAFLLSLFLTRLCVTYLPKFGYIDQPGGRHIHKRIVPRGGGIAIIISFFLVLLLSIVIMNDTAKLKQLVVLCLPTLPLICLNLVDDRKELSSGLKLVVQLFAAGLAWFILKPNIILYGWHIPHFLSFCLTEAWIIIVMNAFNLVDGLDGLASGLSIISLIGFALSFLIRAQNYFLVFEILLLTSAILGFLVFNFNPAKIFLGDTGSTFLGFLIAIAGILVLENKNLVFSSFFVPILLIGMPLIDVLFAIWRRSARKLIDPNATGIMEGDKDHLHHRLLRQFNGNQRIAVGILYLFELGLIAVSILFQLYFEKKGGAAAAVMLILFMVIVRQLGIIELNDSSKIVQQDWMRKRIILICNIFHPTIDNLEIVLSYLIASYLVFQSIVSWFLLICLVLPISLLMGIRHIHRINWVRGGIQNYAKLMATLTFGTILGCISGYIYLTLTQPSSIQSPRIFFLFSLLFYLLNLMFILFERFLLHYMECFWMSNLRLLSKNNEYKHILVYGGGLQCRLLVTYMYSTAQSEKKEGIIGIIDDDKSLRNMTAFGFPILGTSLDLEEIYMKRPFDKIILTISEENSLRENMLYLFCRKHNVELERMTLNFISCFSSSNKENDLNTNSPSQIKL